jgi:DNA recombination protein RmuC
MLMPDWVVPALLLVNVSLLAWLLARKPPYEQQAQAMRHEVQEAARNTRQELATSLAILQQALLAQGGEAVRTQNDQIDAFRTQLAQMHQMLAGGLQQNTVALSQQVQGARDAQDAALRRFSDAMADQVRAMAESNERRLVDVRATVEARLAALQEGNEKKLEQMRSTVDEKLHATLEQRLGESFRQVADRLEQVHRGLGEMQGLARDVGSLSRVLNNVKTRGTLGEVQLAGLLEQVFTPEQYASNVETVPGTNARVDFAIRLPGRGDEGRPMWLPIDCKFPRDDYERLLDAQQHADAAGAEAAAKAIESRLRLEARSIRDKYIAAPHTTDFGLLFVPTEGLYAEALRRPGLVEALQREFRIILTGPTTLLATLTSLQMGFRSLALERRSAEVWEVLGAVKTEFEKFGHVLSRVKGQTQTMLNTLGQAETRTRQMTRALKGVESLPDERVQALLPGGLAGDETMPDA